MTGHSSSLSKFAFSSRRFTRAGDQSLCSMLAAGMPVSRSAARFQSMIFSELAINLVAGHRVECIDDRHQTRAKRKLLAALLVRLAAAIKPCSRALHDVKHRGRAATRSQNVGAHLTVPLDNVVLVRSQWRGLEQ